MITIITIIIVKIIVIIIIIIIIVREGVQYSYSLPLRGWAVGDESVDSRAWYLPLLSLVVVVANHIPH